MRDPYSVLGVSKNASDSDVKSAYRKLAKRHHPDQNANDPKAKDRFAELNAAYEILGDKDTRRRFDRGEIGSDGKPRFQGFEGFTRRAAGSGGPGGGGFGGGSQRGGSGGGSFEDILNDLFGGMSGGAGSPGAAGASPRTSDRGFSNYNRTGSSSSSASAGCRSSGNPNTDHQGNHQGNGGLDVMLTQKITLEEAISQTKTRVKLPSGKIVDVKIPAGVEEGQQIRLRGQGHSAPPGPTNASPPASSPGDAIITLSFEPHPLFKPEGANLRLELPISLDEAVLGARVRVPTLDGSVDMAIPAGFSGGKVFRLRGKGLAKSAKERGDLLVMPSLRLPPGPPSKELIRAAEHLRRSGLSPRGPEFEG